MSIPKPLLPKTLEKRYSEIPEDAKNFLKDFFTAASRIYGLIDIFALEDILYNKLPEAPVIDSVDFWEYAEVARRDPGLPFLVLFETDLFPSEDDFFEQPKTYLADRKLLSNGTNKLSRILNLLYDLYDHPITVPENFMDYK